MSEPAEQKQELGPKEAGDPKSNAPENWPDVPEEEGVEEVEEGGSERVDQMRQADNSDTVSNSTTDTGEGDVGYTDALVDEELDQSGREGLL